MTIRHFPKKSVAVFSVRGLILLLPLLFVFLQGCAKQTVSGKLQVIASIEPLAWFVDRIGGERVSVSVMVPSGANPHSYEPTPKQMALLGKSALFVRAGSGVEFEIDWMRKLLDLNRKIAVCNASEGVTLLPMSEDEHEHGNVTGEHHHEHGHLDPHFWLSPRNGRLIAASVLRALSLLDPAGKEYYEANAAVLDRELEVLDREIRSRLEKMKSRQFLVFHPAWGYFAHDYGLVQIAAEEDGKTLTPRQLQQVISLARNEGIRVVFVSPQFSSNQAEAIARDIGGITVTVDPLARDYAGNLRQATEAFVRSLQ